MHDMRAIAGLLAERRRNAFGFLHLTFQEYFAGRAWPATRLTNVGRFYSRTCQRAGAAYSALHWAPERGRAATQPSEQVC
ncbi:MAG: hypothetical protein H6641_09690 [Caldilineaceae bacterium]|nr:hypothetical protein [Caldilineaceae bacterium]